MNKNREIKIAEKEDFAVDSTHKQTQNQPVQHTLPVRVFCMPSVPRPGVTSWSLVL